MQFDLPFVAEPFFDILINGAAAGALSTLKGAASQANKICSTITKPSLDGLMRVTPLCNYRMIGSPKDVIDNYNGAVQLGTFLGNKLKGDAGDKAYVAGFVLEKVPNYNSKNLGGEAGSSGESQTVYRVFGGDAKAEGFS